MPNNTKETMLTATEEQLVSFTEQGKLVAGHTLAFKDKQLTRIIRRLDVECRSAFERGRQAGKNESVESFNEWLDDGCK